MFFAHVIAKRRMAANVLPSFWRAWGLVVLDMALVGGLLAAVFMPIVTFIYVTQPSDQATGLFLFVLYMVVPLYVLINGIRWTRRSRLRY